MDRDCLAVHLDECIEVALIVHSAEGQQFSRSETPIFGTHHEQEVVIPLAKGRVSCITPPTRPLLGADPGTLLDDIPAPASQTLTEHQRTYLAGTVQFLGEINPFTKGLPDVDDSREETRDRQGICGQAE